MSYKILIIEDEVKTSKNLAAALSDEMENLIVECVENGRLGLQKLQETEFDLVILDLKMPDMTGDEVLKEIRKIAPYVQVVVYTNNGNYEILKELTNLGVDGFHEKGGKTNLWNIVADVVSKLRPVEDEERKKLLDKFFKQLPNLSDNELSA